MSVITSAQDGDWGVGATWVGGVAPGNGDQAVVGHDVTVSDSRIIGTSPAATGSPSSWDLEITGAGVLTIASGGHLKLRGYAIYRNGTGTGPALEVNGTLEFDSTLAPTPATDGYDLYPGDGLYCTRRLVMGPGGKITSDASAAWGRIAQNAATFQGVMPQFVGAAGNPAILERLGRSTSAPSMQIGGLVDWISGLDSTMTDVEFRSCWRVNMGAYSAANGLTLERVTFHESPDTVSFTFGAPAPNEGVPRLVRDCTFEVAPSLTEITGWTFDGDGGDGGNVYGAGYVRAGGTGAAAVWEDTLVMAIDGIGQQCAATHTRDVYLLPRTSGNVKGLNPGLSGVTQSYFTDLTMEALNDPDAVGGVDSEGEYIALLASTTGDLAITGLLCIPMHNGKGLGGGEWTNNATGHTIFSRCTLPISSVQLPSIGFGHVGDDGTQTGRAIVRNSIFYNVHDSVGGYKVGWISNDNSDPVLAADVHHNCGHRASASRYPSADGNGYNFKQTDVDAIAGVGDVDVDPWPTMSTTPATRRGELRRLETWARTVLGLSGTRQEVEDAAMAAILVRHLPSHPNYVAGATPGSYRTWVRAGYAPTNASLNTSGSDGSYIGAIAPSGTPPKANVDKGRTGPHDPDDPSYVASDYYTPDFHGYEIFAGAPVGSPMKEIVRRIDADAVHRHDGEMMRYFRPGGEWWDVKIRPDFAYIIPGQPGYNSRYAGSPLNVVDSDEDVLGTVLVRHEEIVGWEAELWRSDIPVPGLPSDGRVQGYNGTVPPSSPVLDGNGNLKDAHTYTFDRATHRVHETYLTYLHPTDGWVAASYWNYSALTGDWCPGTPDTDGRYVPSGYHRYPCVMINAAGLPMLPLLLRYDEVYIAGEVKHPIGVTLTNDFLSGVWVWPARGAAYQNRAQWGDYKGIRIPYGARLRLTAEWFHANVEDDDEVEAIGPDTPPGGWGPGARVILRCMRRYGLMVADGGENFDLWAVQDSRWPWAGDIEELRLRVKCGYFEVVDHEDDLLEMTVDPPVAAVGVPRTLTFTYHGWERHEFEHPGNEVDNPISTDPGVVGYNTKPWVWAFRPYDQATQAEVGGLAVGEPEHLGLGKITPARPYVSFTVTPTVENLKIFPITFPFGLPWAYGDGVMTIPTTDPVSLSIAQGASVVVPPGDTLQFEEVLSGIGAAQSAVRWYSDFLNLGANGDPPWADYVDGLSGLFTAYDTDPSGVVTVYLVADHSIKATIDVTIAEPPAIREQSLSHHIKMLLLNRMRSF
jgi:hypothetical protein